MGAQSAGAAAILSLYFFTTLHATDLNLANSAVDTTEDSIAAGDDRDSSLTEPYSPPSVADSENRDSSLTVPYSPPSEIEPDQQPSSDRNALPNENDDKVNDARKSFWPKIQLAFSSDNAPRTSAMYNRRLVPEIELIHLQSIPGASALVQCSRDGEFYSVVTPWKQCMMCACVGGSTPQPVCVNCADCAINTGLKVPIPPLSSEAIGDALLAPTALPLFPTRHPPQFPTAQPPQLYTTAEADVLQTLRPTMLSQPVQTQQAPVPQTCTPLPTGEPFQHPFNPCQTCICQTTLRDIQISCIENAQCVVPTEEVALPRLPLASEPVPSPKCANMPFNVPFPHPTDRCKRCQCVEQVSAFNIQEPQLLCVPIPGCDLSTTSLYPTSPIIAIEETIITEPNAFISDNLPELIPAVSTETVFIPTEIITTDITIPVSSSVSPILPNRLTPDVFVPDLSKRPYINTPELISADAYLTPFLTNTLPVSPDGGLIIPQKPFLPHLNPPLSREPSVPDKTPAFILTEIEETIDMVSYNPLGTPTSIAQKLQPNDVDVSLLKKNLEEPLPWPPKRGPLLPTNLEGPLLGPTPHKSCHPYPPNTVFQHPWDDCQVCRCNEYHALGHTSVEVNCYTKASCCVTAEEAQGGQLPGRPQTETIAKDKVLYLEPKCRIRAPNKPFVVDCNVCECRVIYHFVVAKCMPQPKCKERDKLLLGGPEAIIQESQSLTFTIPMNGALRPPPENSAANLISVVAEAGESDTFEQNAFGTKLYQYPSLATYTQPQLPTLTIPNYNQNFVPVNNFASPQMTYYSAENEFNQQNYLLNSVDSQLAGYQYAQPTHQIPFGQQKYQGIQDQTRFLPRSYGNPNYQQWQGAYGQSYAQAQAAAAANAQVLANAQAVANAQSQAVANAQSQAIANAQVLANAQAIANAQANVAGAQNGLFPSYDLSSSMYNNWRKDSRPVDEFPSSSGVETSSAAAATSTSTNAYPGSANVYPANTIIYPTSASIGVSPASTTVGYDKSTQAFAQAIAGAGGRSVTKGGRGQCQYEGDMYHERCQACHCLAETSPPHQLYSMCYGNPCH